LISHRYDD
jgi:hypothetical protein